MDTKPPVPPAVLVGIQKPEVDDVAHQASLEELGRLVKTLGYEDGVNYQLDFENAQGDTNNLTTIVQTMAGNKEDVVVAITTPAAEAANALTKDTPVIFSAVSSMRA